MGAPESVTIEIANWDDYNPRSDVKHPSWFRLEHSLVDSHKFYDFTHEEFKAWIYFLSLASRENSPRPLILYKHAAHTVRISRKAIDSSIQKLLRNGAITESVTHSERGRDADDTQTGATRRDGTIRNETRRNETPQFDFDAFWKLYPRKIAKTDARGRFDRLMRSQGDFDSLIEAVTRFRSHLEGKGTEEKYIPYPATFLGTAEAPRWRDWLDSENGKCEIRPANEFRGITEILAEQEARR